MEFVRIIVSFIIIFEFQETFDFKMYIIESKISLGVFCIFAGQ